MELTKLTSELSGKSVDEIQAARKQVRDGDFGMVRELLFDSALLLQTWALKEIGASDHRSMVPGIARFRPAREALELVRQLYITLSEHSDTARFSRITATFLRLNQERIMNYISKKGGAVNRHELLASHIIQGGSKMYENCLNGLIEEGLIIEVEHSRKSEFIYKINILL